MRCYLFSSSPHGLLGPENSLTNQKSDTSETLPKGVQGQAFVAALVFEGMLSGCLTIIILNGEEYSQSIR